MWPLLSSQNAVKFTPSNTISFTQGHRKEAQSGEAILLALQSGGAFRTLAIKKGKVVEPSPLVPCLSYVHALERY